MLVPNNPQTVPNAHYDKCMASIETIWNKDRSKVTSYRVVWRKNGRKLNQACDTLQQAEAFKTLIESVDHDYQKAQRALMRANPQTPMFWSVAEDHIARLRKVTDYTRKRYYGYVRTHLKPALDMPVDHIDHDVLADWADWMIAKGLKQKTIKNVHGLLYSIMETAHQRGHIPKNPCTGEYLHEGQEMSAEMSFYTLDEFELFLTVVDEHFHPFFWTLFGSGMRFGEAAALTKQDFDMANGLVRVNKSLKQSGDGGYEVGPPKTRNSVRTIALPARVLEMVGPLVESARVGDSVFTMKQGGQVTSQAIHNHAWRPAMDKAVEDLGLHRVTIHSLRHSHASIMLSAGMDMYDLSKRLGHASYVITADRYTHLLPDQHVKAALIAQKALGN